MPADPLSRWSSKKGSPSGDWKKLKKQYGLKNVKSKLCPKQIFEVLERVNEKVKKFGFGQPQGTPYVWRRAFPKSFTEQV